MPTIPHGTRLPCKYFCRYWKCTMPYVSYASMWFTPIRYEVSRNHDPFITTGTIIRAPYFWCQLFGAGWYNEIAFLAISTHGSYILREGSSTAQQLAIDMNMTKKNVFVIIGSASRHSANQQLVDKIVALTKEQLILQVYPDLKNLPAFDPELSTANTPTSVTAFRRAIEEADGVIICTPEYIFSIPAGLKNALEWCVATTVFSDKPMGLITASASGIKGQEALQLIMKTLTAVFNEDTTLLIQGVKGKINKKGEITDNKTAEELAKFIDSFKALVEDAG